MKKLLLVIFALLLILLVIALPLLLHLDRYRMQIATNLSNRLQRKVAIGRLEAVLFPPAMRFRDFAILDPSGEGALLHVDDLLVPIRFSALFQGQFAPQALNFRGWTATVHRRPNGSWAWEEWIVPSSYATEKSGWPVQVITFDRGECHAVDPYGPAPQEFVIQIMQGGWENARQYVSISGSFASLPSPASFIFQGSGHFAANQNWSGVLEVSDDNHQLKWDVKVNGDQTSVSGHADQWRLDSAYAFLRYYARLPVKAVAAAPEQLLQAWDTHFDWKGNSLNFSQTATVAGGKAEAKGSIQSQSIMPIAHIDLAIQNAKAQPVEAALFGEAPLEGTANGLAHFDLTLSSAAWSSLSGQGAMEIKDGRYMLPGSSTQGLMKAHTMKYLLKKFPGFLGAGLPFGKAAAHWQAKNGVLTFEDAFCNLGDVQVAAAGQYDLSRNGLDAFAAVQIHEKNPKLIDELPAAYVDKGQGKTIIQPMHGHLQGSPAEWRLRAVRTGKIPARLQNKLSRTLRNK